MTKSSCVQIILTPCGKDENKAFPPPVVRGYSAAGPGLAWLGLVGNLSHHMWLLLQPRKEDIRGVVHRPSPRDTKLLKIVLILQQTPKKISNIRIVFKGRKLWQLLIVRTPSQFLTSGNFSWIQMTACLFVGFQESECGYMMKQ